MKTTNLRLVAVAAAVGLGLACLGMASHDRTSFERLFEEPGLLAVWIGLISLASLAPLPLPAGRGRVLLSPIFEFGALLVFGIAPAAWLTVLSRLISCTQVRWTPLPRNLTRLGGGILAVTGAGFVFVALGGETGPGLLTGPVQGIALFLAGSTYVAVSLLNTALGGPRIGPGSEEVFVPRALRVALFAFLGGVLGFVSVRLGVPGTALFVFPLAVVAYAGHLRDRAETGHLQAVRSLMAAVDAADPFTRGHSYRISKMCVKVGRHLGLGESALRELEYAAILHDIGRTAIQHNLWGKAGRLTKEEQTVVRHHPSMGAAWIRQTGFFPGAAAIVESHHEQPDAKGYPQGLRGDAIPAGGRIIMGVAAFDAMTSDRPYRKGLSPEEAFEELLSHSGTQFFSDIVAALIELYSKGILFEEFEEEVLEQYREGERSSRALERFLSRTTPVPEKRGTVQADDGEDDVPMIEFPEVPGEKKSMENERDLTTGGLLRLRVASRSDVGCVRTNNEDSFGAYEGSNAGQGALLILADGMGGAAAGEVASRMAVELVSQNYFDMLDHGSAAEALRRSMLSANAAIHARASGDPVLTGMGTTCTAVSVVGETLHVGHVGDSRAYLIDAGQIRILTRDHTLAAELAGMGGGRAAAPEAARNILTRCLGNQPDVQIDVFELPLDLHTGSVLVLCSDGLSNQVSPSEILDLAGQEEPARACAGLVALARERGGPDNITVQVARLEAA